MVTGVTSGYSVVPGPRGGRGRRRGLRRALEPSRERPYPLTSHRSTSVIFRRGVTKSPILAPSGVTTFLARRVAGVPVPEDPWPSRVPILRRWTADVAARI